MKKIDVIKNVLPLYAIKEGYAVTNTGSISVGYKVHFPAVHMVGKSDIVRAPEDKVGLDLLRILNNAIKALPDYYIFHQQDWTFFDTPKEIENTYDFLNAATRRMYGDKRFLNSCSYIFLSKKNSSFDGKNFESEAVKEFNDTVTNFFLRLDALNPIRMEEEDWRRYLENYFSLDFSDNTSKTLLDFDFEKGKAGMDFDIKGYTVNGDRCIKSLRAFMQNSELSSTKSDRYNSWVFPVVFGVDTPKVVNNVICRHPQKEVKKYVAKFESSIALFKGLMPEGIAAAQEMKQLMENEDFVPVFHNFSVFYFTEHKDKVHNETMDMRIKSAHKIMDIVPSKLSVDLADVFLYCVGGCTSEFKYPVHYYPCFLDEALCFTNFEGKAVQDKNGIVFADHYGTPLVKDLYFEPYHKNIITNWNAVIVGPSGTGKSVLTNYILSSMYSQDFFYVIVDIGNSYKQLCSLLGGQYVRIDPDSGLEMNPFLLPLIDPTDYDNSIALREEFAALRSILFTAWTSTEQNKENDVALMQMDTPNSRQTVTNLITDFYKWRFDEKKEYVNFDDFYNFIERKHKENKIKTNFFDVESFLLITAKYKTGQPLGFLFNGKDNINDFSKYRMIVFELGDVQNDKLLFRLITNIIMMLTNNIIMRAQAKLRQVWLDECWRMLLDPDFGVFIKMLSKTIRKAGGGISVIVQELGDILEKSEHGEAIINNAGTFMALSHEGKEEQIRKFQSQLNMSNEEMSLLLSIKIKDRKVFIKQGGKNYGVYGVKISPEHYACFTTTENERKLIYTLIEKYQGNTIRAIEEFVERKTNNLLIDENTH